MGDGPGYFEISTDAFAPYENAISTGLHDRASHSTMSRKSVSAIVQASSMRPKRCRQWYPGSGPRQYVTS